jgi:hypothetical protein
MYQLDNIDIQIHSNAKKSPGSRISSIIKPLQGNAMTDEGLRLRVKKLAEAGFLRLEKAPHNRVLVYPNE